MTSLLLRNVRPHGGEACDILIRDGRIAGLGRFEAEPGMHVEDGKGAIAVPGLIDAHTHLDKTTWGMPWHENNRRAVLRERIDFERDNRIEIGIDPHRQSMRHAIGLAAHGATHIRSHVDIDPRHKLALVEGVMETREKLKGIIDIEIVAFPQSGLMVMPGTLELLDEALSEGCEVLGGIDPCEIDRDPRGQLDAIFAVAERRGAGIDIHLHEPGEMGLFSLQEICARAKAHAMQGRVTVSHGFCLGGVAESKQQEAAAMMAESGVALVSHGAGSATLPPLLLLRRAGVRVFCGNDDVRDSWSPYGTGDMLERAAVIGWRVDLRHDELLGELFDMVSGAGAAALGIAEHGVAPGLPATFFTLPAENIPEAIGAHPPRRLVFFRGRLVARDGAWCGDAAPGGGG